MFMAAKRSSCVAALVAMTSLSTTLATVAKEPLATLAVTSADGAEGFAIINALLLDPGIEPPSLLASQIVALVTDPSSTEARSLHRAGCTIRLETSPSAFVNTRWALILPPLTDDRLEVATAAIKAAAAAHVETAFLLSVIGADGADPPPSLNDYGKLERLLSTAFPGGSAGGTAVVLQTFFYSSNLLLWAADVKNTSSFRLPLSSTSCLAPLYEADVASTVAALISHSQPQPGALSSRYPLASRTLKLTGPRWHRGATIADAASAAVGVPFAFVPADRRISESILQRSALTPSEVALLLDLIDLQQLPGQPACEGAPGSADFAALTGRNATSVLRFFQENAQAFRPQK